MACLNAHIFIVDDNPENIQVLGAVLTQNQYQITVIADSTLVMEAAEKCQPDLILLDVMMPKMDGFQVCRLLKNNPRTKNIEIIFLTAVVTQSEELKGLSLGAVDYIHKPFSTSIVQAKVALHLERIWHQRLKDDVERMTRHDLKNPLNILLGYPQLMLEDNNLTPAQQEYLQEMLNAGKEMLEMINNSLNLFKIETGNYQYMPQPMDLTELLRTVIKDLHMFAKSHGVAIETLSKLHTNPVHFLVLAEKNLSYSLFANLIRNAIEACSKGDTVTIELDSESNYNVVCIINPGTVPETIRDRFFDKYVTAGKTDGTGLGTYIAKLMTEIQKGKISMSTNSRETRIKVHLPLILIE